MPAHPARQGGDRGCLLSTLRAKTSLILSRRLPGSIPFACQDWANTKAAYRFFANERVEEADILSGHFAATRARYDDCRGLILLIQDTTEFSYQRANTSAIGLTKSVNSGQDKDGRWRHHTVCGMLMHSSLAVTVEGLPLGLAARATGPQNAALRQAHCASGHLGRAEAPRRDRVPRQVATPSSKAYGTTCDNRAGRSQQAVP
jgi:hypothetical protein